jgi:hypothetical protein
VWKVLDKDTIKEIAYGVIILVAAIIKHYKDKKDRKKNSETQTVEMARIAQQIAEDQAARIQVDAARLKKELDDAASKLAEQTARYAAEERKMREMQSGIELDQRIDKEVRHAEGKILNAFHVQRMYVIHFSNGTVTEAGIHLMKMSFMSEVVEHFSVERIAGYFKETPIPEMFKSPMTLILAGATYYVQDIDEEKPVTPAQREYYDWLTSYKVKSTLWLPIHNSNRKTVAILVMHWFASTHLSTVELSRIRDMKSEIETIYNKLNKQ